MSNNAKYPKDAQVIIAILQELGIEEFDPKVINQLLEFVYWHTTVILDDARVFSNHAKKKNIDVNDVKLAIQMHSEKMSSAGPPRDLLLEMARAKNSTSLAPIKPQSGIRLPPDRYCLTQTNYRLKSKLPSQTSTATKKTSFNMNVSSIPTKLVSSPSTMKQMPTIVSRTLPSTLNLSKNFSSGTNPERNVSNCNPVEESFTFGELKQEKTELEEMNVVDSLNDHL